jgi:hypothetical protein
MCGGRELGAALETLARDFSRQEEDEHFQAILSKYDIRGGQMIAGDSR